LALISAELGKARQAETFVNQAIQAHAENPQAHYVASYLNLKKGDISAAEKRCLAAIQVDPNYWKAYELLSLVYFEQRRYSDHAAFAQTATVRLDADVARVFKDAQSVNAALRAAIALGAIVQAAKPAAEPEKAQAPEPVQTEERAEATPESEAAEEASAE
jgi:Tfp pilus assembly protein PilF